MARNSQMKDFEFWLVNHACALSAYTLPRKRAEQFSSTAFLSTIQRLVRQPVELERPYELHTERHIFYQNRYSKMLLAKIGPVKLRSKL